MILKLLDPISNIGEKCLENKIQYTKMWNCLKRPNFSVFSKNFHLFIIS